jgi:uncharacterized protein (TIGR02217 family)
LGRWQAVHGLKTPADAGLLVSFFNAVGQGRTNGFRWLDHLDYQDDGVGTVQRNSAGALQLAKTYTAGAPVVSGAFLPRFVRFIDKPVPGVVIAGGGTVDVTTGLTTGAALGAAWAGTFHVPARFDVDSMDLSLDLPYGQGGDVAVSWRHIPIVEIRMPVLAH